jgi:hypothetical protein
MVDRYTKIVLTVIALALVALVLRPALEPQVATALSECGSFSNPCYVTTRSGDSVNVKIVTR